MPTRTKRPTFSWANVSLVDQAYLMEEIGGDGHTIWKADALISEGCPAYVINHFTRVQKSDGSWKGSIWDNDGNMIDQVAAVYGLDVIRSLAAHYGVTSTKFGRGSEARELTEGIREHLAKALKEAGE